MAVTSELFELRTGALGTIAGSGVGRSVCRFRGTLLAVFAPSCCVPPFHVLALRLAGWMVTMVSRGRSTLPVRKCVEVALSGSGKGWEFKWWLSLSLGMGLLVEK